MENRKYSLHGNGMRKGNLELGIAHTMYNIIMLWQRLLVATEWKRENGKTLSCTHRNDMDQIEYHLTDNGICGHGNVQRMQHDARKR